MKLCEYSDCKEQANYYIDVNGCRTFYCFQHLKTVKQKLVGV